MTTIREVGVETAGAASGEYDLGEAFGEHAIEWWVYDGVRLVPASPALGAMLSRLHDAPLPRRRADRWWARAGRARRGAVRGS